MGRNAEPEKICDQCGKKITDKLFKEKIGGQEKLFCSKDCIKMFKVNIEGQRIISEERAEKQIDFLEREIEYKKNQLTNGITETRLINVSPGQQATIVDGYKDGLKPAYILENEIDKDNQIIKEHKRQIENIKKAREEDASRSN